VKTTAEAIPALVSAVPARPYSGGRSRFVLTPLSLTLDQFLLLITAALLCFGLLMVQSADARVRGVNENWLLASFQNKNAIHALMSMVALTFFWRIDYRRFLGLNQRALDGGNPPALSMLLSPATWLLVVTCGMLAAVMVVGREINGARRWLAIGPLGFQPSELAKLALVLFISAYAVHRAHRVRSFVFGFIPVVLAFGACTVLVLKADFGTAALLGTVSFFMLLMAGCRPWHTFMLLPPAAFAVWKLIFSDPTSWRYKRFLAFLDPTADPGGAGYHPMQSLLTITSGGFWGRGLGNGIQKMGYLPEDNTDFIFAVICEELGFIGSLMVIGLFIAFVVIGWRIASRCTNHFGKMVAFGITGMIGLQAAMNIAVVTASMPTKGIALPFISSGGTGWIMNAAAVGVLMSIERMNRREAAANLMNRRGAEPALGFPVQVHAVESVAAVPAVEAVPQ
jgi:cell division protein FtsW